jgi:hypothetical protein
MDASHKPPSMSPQDLGANLHMALAPIHILCNEAHSKLLPPSCIIYEFHHGVGRRKARYIHIENIAILLPKLYIHKLQEVMVPPSTKLINEWNV